MARPKTQTTEERKAYQTKYRAEHRDKAIEYAKEYYRGNVDKFNGLAGWGAHLKRAYDVSLDWWAGKLVEQAGECAICNKQMYKPHVDHDHSKLKGEGNRGLLCNECNHLIGNANDDVEILFAATRYLMKHERN